MTYLLSRGPTFWQQHVGLNILTLEFCEDSNIQTIAELDILLYLFVAQTVALWASGALPGGSCTHLTYSNQWAIVVFFWKSIAYFWRIWCSGRIFQHKEEGVVFNEKVLGTCTSWLNEVRYYFRIWHLVDTDVFHEVFTNMFFKNVMA